MSTTVTYKGATIATADNQTKTLLTAGKYLEGNIVITDTGGGGGGLQMYTSTQSNGNEIELPSGVSASDFLNGNVKAAYLEGVEVDFENLDGTVETFGYMPLYFDSDSVVIGLASGVHYGIVDGVPLFSDDTSITMVNFIDPANYDAYPVTSITSLCVIM